MSEDSQKSLKKDFTIQQTEAEKKLQERMMRYIKQGGTLKSNIKITATGFEKIG